MASPRFARLLATAGLVAVLTATGCARQSAENDVEPADVAEVPPRDLLAKLERYAACIRANGVDGYPSPQLLADGTVQELPTGVTLPATALRAAQSVCASLRQGIPADGEVTDPVEVDRLRAAALAFAKCMRAEGVADYPDPKFDSEGRLEPTVSPAPTGNAATVYAAAVEKCEPAHQEP